VSGTSNLATIAVGTLNYAGPLSISTLNVSGTSNLSGILSGSSMNLTGTANIANLVTSNLGFSGGLAAPSYTGGSLNITGTSNLANLVSSNIFGGIIGATDINGTSLNITGTSNLSNIVSSNIFGTIVRSTALTGSALNVSGASNLFSLTTTQLGVNGATSLITINASGTSNLSTLVVPGTTTFGSDVYGIPLHTTIACSAENGSVKIDGSAVSTITAPVNMLITGTRAYLVNTNPTATLTINVLYGTSLASLTSIYSGVSYMTVGANQPVSWTGTGSSGGTLSTLSGVSVSQGHYIRITSTGSGTAPKGLKVILYYKQIP
jgi:hypothetical protein